MNESDVRARIERHPVEGSVEAMRAAFAALADLPLDASGLTTTRTTLAGLDTLSVAPRTPEGTAARAPIVHLHGGGYVFGSPATHARLACVLARAAGATVHVPAYPLAPEHPWPAQRETMLEWLAELDVPAGVCLSGDSAGGHLALALALGPPPARPVRLRGLALFSPNTTRDYARSASRAANAGRDAMNDPGTDDRLARLAFGETRADDPEQTLLARDLSGLPPLHLDVGSGEILLDDTLRLARQAALADVDVELHVTAGAFHLRQLFAQHWEAADASLRRAGRWLGRRASID